jgi:hypothetical protein
MGTHGQPFHLQGRIPSSSSAGIGDLTGDHQFNAVLHVTLVNKAQECTNVTILLQQQSLCVSG